jgi:hypothetical protein
MDMATINWLAVLVAGISAFVVGGIWYSPGLFGKAWMSEKFSEQQIKQGNKGMIFGFTLIFSLVMSANLAMFLNDPKTDLSWGMTAGLPGRDLDLLRHCYTQPLRIKKLETDLYQWRIQSCILNTDGRYY